MDPAANAGSMPSSTPCRRPTQLNMDIMRRVFELFAESARRGQTTVNEDIGLDTRTTKELARFALVCRGWALQASAVLWADLTPALAYDGFFAPGVLDTLSRCPYLGHSVRTLHIINTLEGGLWHSSEVNEGDIFAGIVRCCPNLSDVVVPTFEVANLSNVIDALTGLTQMRHFCVRVYIESARRSLRFAALIPYADWTFDICALLLASWPRLESFVVRHVPMEAYHMRVFEHTFVHSRPSISPIAGPDIVLAPASCPQALATAAPVRSMSLKRLELRETFINDAGLFHIIGQNTLTELCLMSCQGITSSLITKSGLFAAIAGNGATLKKLTVMTPWMSSEGPHKFVVDEAIRSCTALTSLTVAGWDVSDAVFVNLPTHVRLRHLGITDFEAITPSGLLDALKRQASLKELRRLALWQRNGGVSQNDVRIPTGWYGSLCERRHGEFVGTLIAHGIAFGIGWESRLLSGGEIPYHTCSGCSHPRIPPLA